MDRHQFGAFRLTRNANSNDLLLLAEGPPVYKSVLGRALPALTFSRTFPDRFGHFNWGTYIRGADPTLETDLRKLCEMLQRVILLADDLDESYALSFHTQMSPTGGSERTQLGKLVRLAKPYDRANNRGDLSEAARLAGQMADFVRMHPTYCRAEIVTAVPPSNLNKSFDLPTVLAREIAKLTGVRYEHGLQKSRTTRPMKECRTVQEKIENLCDVFVATPAIFAGRRVILIDDIYETGFTINEVGRAISASGAAQVLGLVATKTARDLAVDLLKKEGESDEIPF